MKADGSNQRNRTNDPAVLEIDPSWVPNGRRIAFMSDRDGDGDGDGEIYTMRPNGSGVRQLSSMTRRSTSARTGRPTAE